MSPYENNVWVVEKIMQHGVGYFGEDDLFGDEKLTKLHREASKSDKALFEYIIKNYPNAVY